MDAELADEVGERRAGPGDPPVGLEEAPLALPRQQRLAVVELADEVEPLAQRLRRVEQPEAGAAHPGGHAGGGEDVLGEERGRADRRILGKPEAERAAGVDGAAEDDDRVDPPRAPVGGDLVAEHPALGVAADVDLVVAGLGADPVDRLVDREHVVVEGALEAALLALGRAEVDDPRIDAVAAQDLDRAGRGSDVVDVGGEHHRRHEQQGRARRRLRSLPGGGREVAAQPVDRPRRDDLEGRRLLVGLEAAEAGHLERVLRRGAEPAGRRGDQIFDERHSVSPVIAAVSSPPLPERLYPGAVCNRFRNMASADSLRSPRSRSRGIGR